MINSLSSKRGFSIAEVLIGIAVITITIVSVSVLVVNTIRANSANLNSFVASQLSQEGLELFRNMRDSNWLRNLDWMGSQQFAQVGGYVPLLPEGTAQYIMIDHSVNYPGNLDTKFIPNNSQDSLLPWKITVLGKNDIETDSIKLYRCTGDAHSVVYVHDGKRFGCEKPSLYSRYLSVKQMPSEYDDAPPVLEVHSIVEWLDKGFKKRVELVQEFTDWRRGPL